MNAPRDRTCSLIFQYLTPRKLHRRVNLRNNFSRKELNRGIDACRLCHDGIHDSYDEMTLAKSFPDMRRSGAIPGWPRHFEWVARQKCMG